MLVTSTTAARALGVTRQRIEQLVRRGQLGRVGNARRFGIPWNEVEQRAAQRGKVITFTPEPFTPCACGSLSKYPHPHRPPKVLKTWPACAAEGCKRHTRTDSPYCARCRIGYATTTPPWRVAQFSGILCSACERPVSPIRVRSCRFYRVAPLCVSCLSSTDMQRMRNGRRLNGRGPLTKKGVVG